ncbi:phosphotransferase family protein [Paenibacillus piri]|uniref:Aminoglycoside phosphotransferase family protein n=1 Tax=Paenibacillus piri TaxID=2547395 RepID=A0A4R5KQZ8_9BACL|nr:phosphotransferase [Paenibacillus piri]TDF97190.1 aminoglycoside phosphotransferase family protein [Paenibacillus piri]
MKDQWERTEAPAVMELPQIEALVGPVFGGKRVTAAERLGEGFSNSNYKLRIEGSREPYVLRLYRGGPEVAGKELAISELIADSVPVPRIVAADWSGTQWEKPWAVMEWKEGTLLRDVSRQGEKWDTAAAAVSVGSTLARIHAYTFPEAGFLGAELSVAQPFKMDAGSFTAFIEDSLFAKRCGHWLGDELVQALWALCLKYAPQLSEHQEAPVLVHSDFNGLNLLIGEAPGREVTAVLDWEFAFSGSRLTDIGNILRYEENDSWFERHLTSAYVRSGGVLPANWKLLSKLEDLIALCDMLNGSTSETPNRVRDLKRLVAKTAAEFA